MTDAFFPFQAADAVRALGGLGLFFVIWPYTLTALRLRERPTRMDYRLNALAALLILPAAWADIGLLAAGLTALWGLMSVAALALRRPLSVQRLTPAAIPRSALAAPDRAALDSGA